MNHNQLTEWYEKLSSAIDNENFNTTLLQLMEENKDKTKEEIKEIIQNDFLLKDYKELKDLFGVVKRVITQEQIHKNLLEEMIISYNNPEYNAQLGKLVKQCFDEGKTITQSRQIIKNTFGETEKDKKPTKVVFGLDDSGKLFHQIKVDNKLFFLTEDNETVETVYVNGEECICQDGEEVLKGVIVLPDGIENYGSKQELIDEITEFIHRYVDISPEFEKWAVFYILFSWLYDRFDTVPYLRALGDTGTGKTRFLDVILDLCFIPIKSTGASSPAATFRLIERWKGTLGMDEGDLPKSDETQDMIKILNNGFQRDKPVIKVDKNNPSEINTFRCFGPKIITTRKTFWDAATESRCITEVMRETERHDLPDLLPKIFHEKGNELRRKLLKFRFDMYNKINPEIIHDVDLSGVEPRLRQASRSFIILFSDNEEELENYKQWLIKYNDELREERAGTNDGIIINSIINKLRIGKFNITAKDIKEKLGEKATTQYVGKAFRRLGLKTQARTSDKKRSRYLVLDPIILKIGRRYMKIEDFKVFITELGQQINPKMTHYEHVERLYGGQQILHTLLNNEDGCERGVQNHSNVQHVQHVQEEDKEINDILDRIDKKGGEIE